MVDKMRRNYMFLVAADYKYIPELTALLNSLEYVGNVHDVHIVGVNLTKEFKEQLPLLSYQAILHEISEEEVQESRGISEVVCRKRYWYAAEYGKDYKAVCILDADLIFNRDVTQFFVIAEKTGFILGPTKEQNKVYDDDHHLVDGKWIWNFPRGHYNERDMCNCPVFLDANFYADPLQFSWEIFHKHGFKAPDMDAMNMCFIDYAGPGSIVRLAGLQWLGTNEQMLKPYIRAVERHGKLYTECGLEIYCYHGHYYHSKWRECQLANRHHCAQGYLKASECSDDMAIGAMALLYSNFIKMLDYRIIIEKKNYRE
jgi:hypothetical protein